MSTFGTVSLSDDMVIFNRWGGTSYGMIENVEAIARARADAARLLPPDHPGFLELMTHSLPFYLPAGSFIMYGDEARDRRSKSFDMKINVKAPKAPSVLDFYDMTEEEPYQDDDEVYDFPPMPEQAKEPLTWEEACRLSEIIDGYEKESEYYVNPDNPNEWFFMSTE